MGNLQHEISTLSTAEKFELLDMLWESLEADESALTDEQNSELARHSMNPQEVIPWEQVRANVTRKH